MRQFCETLESRTLLSGTVDSVTSDYGAVVGDGKILKEDFISAVATYKADAKVIAADIKALGKSPTNSKYVALLNKAVSKATGPDNSVGNALISAGTTAIKRAKSAFTADFNHPSTANAAKLTKGLSSLAIALAPFEAKVSTAVTTGEANVDAALNALVTANPTDTTLASAVTNSEADQASALSTISSAVATTNTDIAQLISDII